MGTSRHRIGMVGAALTLAVWVAPAHAQEDSAPGEQAPGEQAPGEQAPGEQAPGEQAPAGRVRGAVHQQLVALLNPMGLEHQLRVGLRASLGDQRELLFDGAHAEAGGVSYVSPVYAIQGGYLQVSPLSFLVLRVEITGAVMWPIGMEAAGYYGLSGYGDDVRGQALRPELGGSASGWNISLMGQLQGRLPLGPVSLVMADGLQVEHDTLGDAPFYYSQKHDLVLAQQDWVVLNDAVVMLEATLEPDLVLHAGVFSNLRFVPGSDYVGHQLGPIVALSFERPIPEIGSITPFIRGAYYTHHVTRADELTVLGGVSIDYDLGAIR